MISEIVVELSRWQFAITALFHFLFIPLTLGLSVLVTVLETLYLLSGQVSYQSACQFWGRILAVNFALGVASRLALVFQFGMNGSYFAHYVGDVFAVPLAIDALSSFFLASLLFGPYLFGWDRFSRRQHLLITWLLTIALNASAVFVLIACGWLQSPVGVVFDYHALRMELSDLSLLLHNPPAISKAIHGITAAYVTAAASVLAISAWLLLKNPKDVLARHSFRLAAVLGLAASLAVWLGDATPRQTNPVQVRKLAALEGEEHSKLLADIEIRIRNGVKAYALLQELRDDKTEPQLLADFKRFQPDLGYALLLQHWNDHIAQATDQQVSQAAQAALPSPPALLQGANRAMIACGIINLLLFGLALLPGFSSKPLPNWLLQLGLYLFPLSWLACIGGWFVAAAGMQPWAVAEILPTFFSMSSLSVKELLLSLTSYGIVYGGLLAAGLVLIRQTLRSHLATTTPGVEL
jgi:cytochrome d ubiquinol oxidase subunit I